VSELVAPAKLTWSLRVVGTRDDGLHLLEAEMVTLDLADTIELVAADGEAPRFFVAAEPPASAADAALGDDDLVRRALAAVGARAHVRLRKRIPLGAGLGGGSADAAAVLRWAGAREVSIARELGADVPFCVVGGRAMVRGVGDEVEPLEHVDRTVTLAFVPFGVDTAACYRAYDALGDGARRDDRNDLTAAALAVEPRLGPLRVALGEHLGAPMVLAGSGSTLFCEGNPLGLAAGVTAVEVAHTQVRLVVAKTRDAESP
jgi:4-diphosphocytidyl-2-C-methyl-D-erythritol kinase